MSIEREAVERLDPCPKCGASDWTDAPDNLFIRNMVECRKCGIRIRRELLTERG